MIFSGCGHHRGVVQLVDLVHRARRGRGVVGPSGPVQHRPHVGVAGLDGRVAVDPDRPVPGGGTDRRQPHRVCSVLTPEVSWSRRPEHPGVRPSHPAGRGARPSAGGVQRRLEVDVHRNASGVTNGRKLL